MLAFFKACFNVNCDAYLLNKLTIINGRMELFDSYIFRDVYCVKFINSRMVVFVMFEKSRESPCKSFKYHEILR